MSYKNKRGFTLIELLVVIAIIGILASVVLASLNSARSKAKNAAMFSNMDQFSKALELFFLENGLYPDADGWACVGAYSDGLCWGNGTPDHNVEAAFNASMAPYMYIADMQVPTSANPEGSMYGDRNSRTAYELIFTLEGDNQSCGSYARRRETSSSASSANANNGSTACVKCVNHTHSWCVDAY